MPLAYAIAMAACGATFAALGLRSTCRKLDPAKITEYSTEVGRWEEARRNGSDSGLLMVPQQPINTYTNVAYAAAGFFLLFYLNTLPAAMFFLAALYLCAGSGIFHATSTLWARKLDFTAMYALYSSLALYAVLTYFRLEGALVASIMFVAAILFGWLLRNIVGTGMSVVLGIFVAVTYAFAVWSMLEYDKKEALGYLIASFALFLVGYIAWNLDKIDSAPLGRWGHAVWHIFTASATSVLFYGIKLTF